MHFEKNTKNSVVPRLMVNNLSYKIPNMVFEFIMHIIQVIRLIYATLS